MPRPAILAHRGASGSALENTLEAFRLAGQLGADGIELDVHPTADGCLVVHHDPELAGVGPIADHSLRQLRARPLANGEPLPTLTEALASAGRLAVWVELKALPDTADRLLLDTLSAGPDPEHYGIHSFDHRIIARLARRQTGFRLGCLLSARLLDPVTPIRAAGATVLWQEAGWIDAGLVEQVHAAGIELIAWTVDEPDRIRALAALGVDGICGNHPDQIRAALSG